MGRCLTTDRAGWFGCLVCTSTLYILTLTNDPALLTSCSTDLWKADYTIL